MQHILFAALRDEGKDIPVTDGHAALKKMERFELVGFLALDQDPRIAAGE